MSAAESGKNTSDTLAAGMSAKEVDDIRSSVIAAGAGQRVNPGFFDSRNTVSKEELERAKKFNPTAFKRNRSGGIMDFIRGGGFLGSIIRNIGQRAGLGKKFNEPTYDMSQFNKLTLGGVDPFANLDIRDIFDRRKINEEEEYEPQFNRMFDTDGIANLIQERKNYENFLESSPSFVSFDEYKQNISQAPKEGILKSSSLNDLTPDQLQQRVDIANQFDLPVDYSASDLDARARRAMTQPGFMATLEPTGIGTVTAYDPYKEMYSDLPSDNLRTEVSQDDINKSKTKTFKAMDFDTYKMINPKSKINEFEFKGLQEGTITEPGTYTT